MSWICVPFAVEAYGAWEVEACKAFSFLARQEGIITDTLKSKVLGDLLGRLSFILIQSNTRAALARSGLVLILKLTQHALGSSFSFVHVCVMFVILVKFIELT